MPLVSRLGAASSRGFGQFSQQTSGKYVEDYFSPYVYAGTGSSQTIATGVPLADTAAWSLYGFTDTYSGAALSTTLDSSGNIYVGGSISDGISNFGYVGKFSSSGTLLWQKKISGVSSCTISGIAVDSSGNVIACGDADDGTRTCSILVKFNSSGTLQWQKRYYNSASQAYRCTVDSSGNIYFTGWSNSNQYMLVAKTDSSGVIQWAYNVYFSGYSGIGYDVALDPSGNVCATGYYTDSSGYNFIAIVKLDSSGNFLWKRKLGQNQSRGRGIAVDSSSNIIVTGQADDGTRTYAIIAKYNSSGTLQWQRKVYQDTTYGRGVSVDSSGNVYFTGYGNDLSRYGMWVVKYDSSGTLQWQRKLYADSGVGYQTYCDSSGNLFVGGGISVPNGQIGAIVKLQQDGSTTGGGFVIGASYGAARLVMVSGTATSANAGASDSAASAAESSASLVEASGVTTITAGSTVTSVGTQPTVTGAGGLVWFKGRTGSGGTWNNALYDTLRGTSNALASNLTNGNIAWTNSLESFNASGFTVGTDTAGVTNTSSNNYVAWTFRETPKFFDIVTWTGNGGTQNISHSLGSAPGMIWVKRTDSSSNWVCYHRSLPSGYILYPNSTAAQDNFGTIPQGTFGDNSTPVAPTSTQFTIGSQATVNASGGTYVAYLFAHDAGGFGADGSQNVISCGSYTGNGSSSGPVITLGYEPQWVMIKRTDTTGNWWMMDVMRGMSQTDSFDLQANASTGELTDGASYARPLATGFSPGISYSGVNASGGTYIYMAIRRGPMRTPTSGTSVYTPVTYGGSGVANRVLQTAIQPDVVLWAARNRYSYNDNFFLDRLRGVNQASGTVGGGLATNLANAESPNANYQISALNNSSVKFGSLSYNGFDQSGLTGIQWNFTRAPGFMDSVCYSGTSSPQNISHNLGVVPELIIFKVRNSTFGWPVWRTANGTGNTWGLMLNTSDPEANQGAPLLDATPTSTVFRPTAYNPTNGTGYQYVAYLFATLPGVSKVGSYTGTGTTQQIDCGFTSGARFVLIKRTDNVGGGWYIYDSARGIVAGNDPYMLLNSSASEVTGTDYVDTYAAGFELSNTAPAGLNANGGTYIFLAIA